MNPVFSTLLRLIRDALNEEGLPRSVLLRSADTAEPSGAADWEAVLQEARAQTVLGLVFPRSRPKPWRHSRPHPPPR